VRGKDCSSVRGNPLGTWKLTLSALSLSKDEGPVRPEGVQPWRRLSPAAGAPSPRCLGVRVSSCKPVSVNIYTEFA